MVLLFKIVESNTYILYLLAITIIVLSIIMIFQRTPEFYSYWNLDIYHKCL